MAYHLQENCPQKSYVILEGREALGGTWDLFRYPGIRSDSTMLTFAYGFKPWREAKTISEGTTILNYLRETAVENGITDHIHYGQQVTQATWSSAEATWTIRTNTGKTYSCNFLLMCAGYYSYENGYTPEFKGRERYIGTIVHPQKWPETLDYANKRIIVIGSGATAVTLVPSLAETAGHVVMLQRSPTYIWPSPDEDTLVNRLRKFLPDKWAFTLARWRSIFFEQFSYGYARREPEKVKEGMLQAVRVELPPDYDVATHFTPSYNPWEQRVCLAPNGDLLKAISAGTASVVTDKITTFTENGILLESGKELEADIIVTATGLNLEVMGGIDFVVDGKVIDFSKTVTYKGVMLSNIPNMVVTIGYVNASWTLRADLIAEYTCRLLNYMDKKGVSRCTPQLTNEADVAKEPSISQFSSGYFQRSLHLIPRQGADEPWVAPQSYWRDRRVIGRAPIDDGVLQFDV